METTELQRKLATKISAAANAIAEYRDKKTADHVVVSPELIRRVAKAENISEAEAIDLISCVLNNPQPDLD